MNRNILKVGLLIALLAIPAFIFIFLKVFGKNKFAIPVLNPVSLECPRNTQGDTVHHVPDFAFVSQEGKTVTRKDFDGKVYVADFFFTRCTNICIDMARELVRVQEHFKDNPQVKILSHSVDPGYDSVAVLQQYAQRYNALPDKWLMVSGDKKALYHQARCGYFLPVPQGNGDENDFIHSNKLVLVDKEKRIRGYYDGTSREDVDKLIMEIQILLSEYEQ